MFDQLQDLGTTLAGHQNAVGSVVKVSLGKSEDGFWIETWKLVSPFSLEMHESRMLAVIVCLEKETVL